MLCCLFGVCVCAFVCSWRGQRSVSNVFLNHSYFLKTGSLAGLKLTDSISAIKPHGSSCLPEITNLRFCNTEITNPCHRAQPFTGILGI